MILPKIFNHSHTYTAFSHIMDPYISFDPFLPNDGSGRGIGSDVLSLPLSQSNAWIVFGGIIFLAAAAVCIGTAYGGSDRGSAGAAGEGAGDHHHSGTEGFFSPGRYYALNGAYAVSTAATLLLTKYLFSSLRYEQAPLVAMLLSLSGVLVAGWLMRAPACLGGFQQSTTTAKTTEGRREVFRSGSSWCSSHIINI